MTFKDMESSDRDPMTLKICFLGDTAVGKTSLCKSLCLSQTIVKENEYDTTIGLDIYKTNYNIGTFITCI